jgi:hypothetical protein
LSSSLAATRMSRSSSTIRMRSLPGTVGSGGAEPLWLPRPLRRVYAFEHWCTDADVRS